MIYIYYSYLSGENHESILKNNLLHFSEEYQHKIKRFRRWQDAQLSLLGRILLFKGMKELGLSYPRDKKVHYTRYNKPYFEDHVIQFNISHSGEIVVCAITDATEIGIDIEIITDVAIDDFKIQMTKNEWNKISNSNDQKNAFFEYWTQKEAVIKAHGHGLTIPLQSFEIIDNQTRIQGEKFYLKEIKIDEKYKCTISSKTTMNAIMLKNIR
ncbi:4'-phosphopantetheinyl transferase superfamily protein [Flavobacterium sp. CLA17]|uniref:4'-phosphopantetheinyl transferase family protein n=1 Tax=Flavobacterium sp. CLA17 TaxID=2724135 RepID=UPI001491D75F|nr:4'-phosphopantetheinyl transferase superfamily protein [Flavobacterium sp. CLA17]QSB25097.1 4'-phosphopantetheinyl transferase superfamily protein [Flavobacterium sp. CLA17]